MGLSANKLIATVFSGARDVIDMDFNEKGKTITVESYSESFWIALVLI